jgi:hypothetical protein
LAQDKKVFTNEMIALDLQTREEKLMYGLQISFNTDGMKLMNITSEYFNIDNCYKVMADGTVNISLSSPSLISIPEGKAVITLHFQNEDLGLISEKFDFTQATFASEIYNENLNPESLQLLFKSIEKVSPEYFKLNQNEPNPFSEKTGVAITLPTSGQLYVTIFDVTGKVIHTQIQDLPKGEHTLELRKDIFPNGGVYYCKIEFNQQSSTLKLIHLK